MDEQYNTELKVEHEDTYDFIIVGAGSSGCVVANRLSEISDWKVLLLEAGSEQPDITLIPSMHNVLRDSNVDWGFSTMPDGKSCLARPKEKCSWPSGRMMGGSSAIDSLLYLRGDMEDYDWWAAMGNTGWSYKDVLPYFKKSEQNLDLKFKHLYAYDGSKPFIDLLNPKYHSIIGHQPVSFSYNADATLKLVKAFAEKGLSFTDFNKNTSLGTGQAQSTIENGIRISTNHAFIKRIRNKRRNLKVRTNSEAVQILIDDGKIAYGVQYRKNGKLKTVLAKKEILLTAGAINSAKLLLLSGIGPKDHLQNLNISVVKHLAVGRNLQFHIGFEGLMIALPKIFRRTTRESLLLKNIYEYGENSIKKGYLSENGPIVTMSFAKSNKKLKSANIQYIIGNLYDWREYCENPVEYGSVNIFPSVYYNGFQPRIKLLTPMSRGKLKLNSQNPHGRPLVYGNFYTDPSDLEAVINATELLYELENTATFLHSGAKFVKRSIPLCENVEWGTKEYSTCLALHYTLIDDNPAGTCKMGPQTDLAAVVDPRLLVHGVEGLRVVDASIMPLITRGSITTASMMIGEKGSDLIKQDWLGRT